MREENRTVEEVLALYTEGPQTGVFTDGASHPNPGPGGWGAVYVRDGQLVAEAFGQDPDTTNNRMELTALIRGFDLVPPGEACEMWTDSNLCVQTVNVWPKVGRRMAGNAKAAKSRTCLWSKSSTLKPGPDRKSNCVGLPHTRGFVGTNTLTHFQRRIAVSSSEPSFGDALHCRLPASIFVPNLSIVPIICSTLVRSRRSVRLTPP